MPNKKSLLTILMLVFLFPLTRNCQLVDIFLSERKVKAEDYTIKSSLAASVTN